MAEKNTLVWKIRKWEKSKLGKFLLYLNDKRTPGFHVFPYWPHPAHGLHDLFPGLTQCHTGSPLQAVLPKLPTPTCACCAIIFLSGETNANGAQCSGHISSSTVSVLPSLHYLERWLEMQVWGGFSIPIDSAFVAVKPRNLHPLEKETSYQSAPGILMHIRD